MKKLLNKELQIKLIKKSHEKIIVHSDDCIVGRSK